MTRRRIGRVSCGVSADTDVNASAISPNTSSTSSPIDT
jgi:hypothetical protein